MSAEASEDGTCPVARAPAAPPGGWNAPTPPDRSAMPQAPEPTDWGIGHATLPLPGRLARRPTDQARALPASRSTEPGCHGAGAGHWPGRHWSLPGCHDAGRCGLACCHGPAEGGGSWRIACAARRPRNVPAVESAGGSCGSGPAGPGWVAADPASSPVRAVSPSSSELRLSCSRRSSAMRRDKASEDRCLSRQRRAFCR